MTFSYDMFESPFLYHFGVPAPTSTLNCFFFSGCERCKGVRSEALSNGVEMTIRSISKEAKYSVTGRPHDRFWETLTAGVVFDILVICISFIICLQI